MLWNEFFDGLQLREISYAVNSSADVLNRSRTAKTA